MELLSSNPYIPWSPDMFMKAVNNLRQTIGVAFDVGFWIFIIIFGIILLRNLIDYFTG